MDGRLKSVAQATIQQHIIKLHQAIGSEQPPAHMAHFLGAESSFGVDATLPATRRDLKLAVLGLSAESRSYRTQAFASQAARQVMETYPSSHCQ